MRVLIFGTTGNCGKYIAKDFLSKGHEVIGVGRSNSPFNHKRFKFIKGDITDPKLYKNIPVNIDLVLNLAGVQPSILPTSEKTNLEKTLSEYVDVNMVGTFNILEFVRKSNIAAYIYTTSHRDLEKHWQSNVFLGNDLPPAINYSGDHTMYAISKTSGKMMGDYYSASFGIRVFNLRLPMIFLVPDSPYYLSHGEPTLMPFLKVIKQAIDGLDLEVWGDPNMRRDYVHIDNLVYLINACYESTLRNGTFNVGTGEAVTTKQFIEKIKDVFDEKNKCKINYRPEKLTYKCAVYDVSEQKQLFNYQPILVEEMLIKIKSKLFELNLENYWK